MKRLFTRIWLTCACACVMLLTGSLIIVFYIATFIRKLIIKDFVPNARRDELDAEEAAPIASANAQMNAVKASLDKTETQRTDSIIA
jgi:hypothetical protein